MGSVEITAPEETKSQEQPLEYQLFSLAFRVDGAIEHFDEYLKTEDVGTLHGNRGIGELYSALLDFYQRTGSDPIDPVAFRSWLESDTNLYDSIGGGVVLDDLFAIFEEQELSTAKTVTNLLQFRASKRRQLDLVQDLQQHIGKKVQTSDDAKKLRTITENIWNLEKDIASNPFESVVVGSQMAERADHIMEMPDFMPTPFASLNRAMGYCVDEKTEALTQRGWLRYEDINTDTDRILTYSPDSCTTQWERPESYYENWEYDGPMISMQSATFDALVTPHHKWTVRTRRAEKIVSKKTFELPNEGNIPRSGNYDGPETKEYDDDFVKLIAWYYTEGSLQKNHTTITIDQSKRTNPVYVEEIRNILKGVGAHWKTEEEHKRFRRNQGLWVTEYMTKTDCICYVLTGYAIDEILRVTSIETKTPTYEFLSKLTPDQALLFVETALKGDGTPSKHIFYQHNEERMNFFMSTAVLAGLRPSLSTDGTACSLLKYDADLKRIRRTSGRYNGLIWCPKTNAGFWLARRNGKVYVTGNTEDGGFYRGGVHAVLAESGKGKTTLCRCFMNHWLNEGKTVLFVNFEEPQHLWEMTLMTQIIKQNVLMNYNRWSDSERAENTEIFKQKVLEWGDRLMVRHDPDTPYFEDMERWVRDLVGHNGKAPDVLIIDTIQSMFSGRGSKPRWGEFEEMMVRLEKLAKDLDCVLIITAQQNANAMKENRDVIMQSDTGGSLTIQQKSTVSMFITPVKDARDDDSISEFVMQLQIPKNRITGTAFRGDPPVIVYNDNIKSYEEFAIPEDGDYVGSFEELENGW